MNLPWVQILWVAVGMPVLTERKSRWHVYVLKLYTTLRLLRNALRCSIFLNLYLSGALLRLRGRVWWCWVESTLFKMLLVACAPPTPVVPVANRFVHKYALIALVLTYHPTGRGGLRLRNAWVSRATFMLFKVQYRYRVQEHHSDMALPSPTAAIREKLLFSA